GGHLLRGPEPFQRHPVSRAGPEVEMNQSRREWLLSDAPQTRRQARMGAFYQGWLTFRGNKLAMLGLIVLVLLIGMAVCAPWLAPQSPFAQDLAGRLQPPSAE